MGRTQQEMAEAAGVSLATWRLLETAGRDRYQDLTTSGVIKSLGWSLDAFDRLLAGDVPARALLEPDPVDDTPSDAVPAGLARTWKELRPSERDRVQGYIDGLFASRTH